MAEKTDTINYVCAVDAATIATGRRAPGGKPEVVRARFKDVITVSRSNRNIIREHVRNGSLVREDRFDGKKKTTRALWAAAKREDDSVANLTAEGGLKVPVDGSIPSIGEFLKANPGGEGGVDTGNGIPNTESENNGGDVADPNGATE